MVMQNPDTGSGPEDSTGRRARKPAKTRGTETEKGNDPFQNEGLTATLSVNLPPTVAKAIRRTGNRRSSISKVFLALIDRRKLDRLLEEDRDFVQSLDKLSGN